MSLPTTARSNLLGALCAIAGVFCFSLNDMAIKFLSGGYALHQVVLFRSAIGLILFCVIIMPMSGGWRVLRTKRLPLHLFRGMCVVFANITFFLGVAALPLADAVAIFFVSPLVISVFSIVFLDERVGPRRWAAIGIGLVGVAIMLRPGSGTFQPAALLPLAAAVGYASLHMMTRHIGGTESAATMSVYIQITFLIVSIASGLVLGDGRFAGHDSPSLEFLFRAWIWPDPGDYPLFVVIGAASMAGGWLISQAYRIAEAGFAAPFEYVAMPLAVFWGVIVFGDWPDRVAWIGIALIVGAGLILLWRERVQGDEVAIKGPKYRR
jgi:drug/metabolite transporter (DMT)-like permease